MATIRKACIEDARRIAEISLECWRSAYSSFVSEKILKNKTIEASVAKWQAIISKGESDTFVLVEKDIVYGYMSIGECRDVDANKDDYEIWAIYVDFSFSRNGYGQMLLQFCENAARLKQKKRLLLWVFKENKIGRSFYEKNNFKPDGAEKWIDSLSAFEIRYLKYF